MSISAEQNAAAASEFAELAEKQFGGSGVTVSVEHHSNAAKYRFRPFDLPSTALDCSCKVDAIRWWRELLFHDYRNALS